jgi:hypothetical protein
MNHFKQIPEELLYLIITYIKDYTKIDMISKVFKLYVDYEEIVRLVMPLTYQLIRKELSKYTDPPNYYLIYVARMDFLLPGNQILLKFNEYINYSNIHGLNYLILWYIHRRYIFIFEHIGKFPEHRDKYLYILSFIDEILANPNKDVFNILFFVYMYIILESHIIKISNKENVMLSNDYCLFVENFTLKEHKYGLISDCKSYLKFNNLSVIDDTIIYRRLIISDLLKKLETI